MFGKLVKWLTFWKKDPEEEFDAYAAQERCLFRYHNGQRWVWADPLPLHQKVMEHSQRIDTLIKVSGIPNQDSYKAHRELCDKLRAVFGVPLLVNDYEIPEGGTLSDTEVVGLLHDFLFFCDSVKKNSRETPTLPATTSDSTGPTSAGNSPTENTSASGLTGSAPSTGPPAPPPSVPESPWGPSSPPPDSSRPSP